MSLMNYWRDKLLLLIIIQNAYCNDEHQKQLAMDV